MTNRRVVSRRSFLQRASAGLVATPYIIPSGVLAAAGKPGANDRVVIGVIGIGGRAKQLLDHLPEEGHIVAAADCELARIPAEHRGTPLRPYQNYHKMLDKEKLDAVIVATPDHGRVLPCIHACQAGLDVYAEKPLTVSIGEGRVLVRAARKYGRVFQVGTQQRTMEMNRFACEFVRNGGIGKLQAVLTVNYPGPNTYTGLPEQPLPPKFDWDMWCGQTELRPYNAALHRSWMAWRAYSGGEMTNWGAHGLDQVQWALGKSHTGPTEVWLDGRGCVRMRYDDGALVRMELDGGPMGGAIFVGSEGKIEINRNKFTTNPPDLIKDPPSPAAAKIWEGPGWIARPHLQNWLDCIKTRGLPNADVEIGFRSVTVCHLAGIVRTVGRKLNWDPVAERFRDDDEANTYLNRPRRQAYALPKEV
jgi:predicted dehydrogenase